jgi:translation initiation factor 3 subunit C
MEKLCKYVYAHDETDRLRTRAILSHIYHHALHDNWFQARDLMLMSHLQETIQHSDPATQASLFLLISFFISLNFLFNLTFKIF